MEVLFYNLIKQGLFFKSYLSQTLLLEEELSYKTIPKPEVSWRHFIASLTGPHHVVTIHHDGTEFTDIHSLQP